MCAPNRRTEWCLLLSGTVSEQNHPARGRTSLWSVACVWSPSVCPASSRRCAVNVQRVSGREPGISGL